MPVYRVAEGFAARTVLADLFLKEVPNPPVLWSVLEGRHKGSAYLDCLEAPVNCLLRTDTVLTFTSRQISQAFLEEAIQYFRSEGQVWLVWSDRMPTHLQAPKPDHIVQRFEFSDLDPSSVQLDALRLHLPEGFTVRPINRSLLERCKWRDEMAFFCGGLEGFLRNGIGLCMMRGDEIIVEAYASSLGAGQAEIGAITHQQYRGRGYAPVACAYLICECARHSYRPYWSCDGENLASIRVAQKLGFPVGKPYQILIYRANGQSL